MTARTEANDDAAGAATVGWSVVPQVSVVLPVRNEGDHIESCLERLLAQDYPQDRFEILVVDGRSDDDTREVVERVRTRHPAAALRLLDNPQRTVPPALNIGIRAARGEIIVRMDGHSVPASNYLSACVANLLSSGAAKVGGLVESKGGTPFGEAVALATGHPFGAGDARYRIGGSPTDVDTVPFGAFRRATFERVGLFDESLVRNEDYEFNVRLRAAGERVFFDPAIRVEYTPRGSVGALASQYFQYGWWKVETVRRHPRSLRWRQAVPPAFLVFLVAALLVAPWWAPAGIALGVTLLGYFGALGVAAWRLARPPVTPVGVLVAFAVIHFAFSAGFLLSLVSRGTFPYRARPPSVPELGSPLPAGAEVTLVAEHVTFRQELVSRQP
jgi:succinoglycan biosynthesis protein ExoA